MLIREELLLTIYERLEAAGIGLAFQTQTIAFSPGQLEALEALTVRPPAQDVPQRRSA